MSHKQYAVYLTPPPELVVPLSVAHTVLALELGSRVAGAFMVHSTVKGFFKLTADASIAALACRLDDVFTRLGSFETEILPPTFASGPRGHSALLPLRLSDAFSSLHANVWDCVLPFVADDCPFTPDEPAGPNFRPHITLAQYDLPSTPGMLEQSRALCSYLHASLGRRTFVAQDLQLVEFDSDDWGGEWWSSLRFHHLRGWRLA